ncbi:hypothetical protein ACFOWU_10040 [Epilithonimonas zeae]|nr:hypothetical protein [Epilithonimonas zeae]
MSEQILADKIENVMLECADETDNPESSRKNFSSKLAAAIINEVKKMTIMATAPNGPVTVTSIE